MRKILIAVVIGIVVMSSILLAVLYGVSDLLPVRPLERVDTGGNKYSVLSKSDRTQAVFGSVALARTDTPKLIVIGPSTVQSGFVQEDWAEVAPCYEFHNFGVGGLTPSETLRLFLHHIEAEVSPQAAKRSVVIIGASYSVVSDYYEKFPNYIESEEKDLLPFYFLSGFDWSGWPVSYAKKMSPAMFFVRTQLPGIIDRGIKAMILTPRPEPAAPPSIAAPPQTVHFTEQMKRETMHIWDDIYMEGKKTISERQFRYLVDLIEYIHAAGFHIVVVYMPLPKWHSEASLYDHLLHKRLNNLMSTKLANLASIEYVDLHDDFGEAEFSDSAHINRAGAKAISRLIASRVTLFREGDGRCHDNNPTGD